MSRPSKFDFIEQASIYGSYHHTTGNRIVHFVCVPAIIYASFLLFEFRPWPLDFRYDLPLPESVTEFATTQCGLPAYALQLTLTLLIVVAYSIYTAMMEKAVGVRTNRMHDHTIALFAILRESEQIRKKKRTDRYFMHISVDVAFLDSRLSFALFP
jgi:uncharacterized membrane protein YGL010W